MTCLGQKLCGLLALHLVELLHQWLVLLKHLIVALWHRTRDDKWCTGIIDKHGVNLIDDGVVVLALYEVAWTDGHVVAEVVEAELVVCTEGYVGLVCLASVLRVRTVLVYTVDAQSVELIERSHPLRVTLSQIVVDSHHVNTVAGERVKEYRECGDEGLTLTGSHLGNLSLMEDNATEELNVVVYHLPFHVVATGRPVVMVYGLVAVDGYEVVLRVCGQLTVEVGSCNHCLLVLGEAACRALYYGEGRRQNLVQGILIFLQLLLMELVYFVEDSLTLVDRSVLDGGAELLLLFAEFLSRVAYILLYLFCLGAELIVAELVYLLIFRLNFLYFRLYLLHVPRRLVAEEGF